MGFSGAGGTDELLAHTTGLFYKWISLPETLLSNDFDDHMFLLRVDREKVREGDAEFCDE